METHMEQCRALENNALSKANKNTGLKCMVLITIAPYVL